MRVTDFDYELPDRLIAQYPAEKRDGSRLLLISKDNDNFEDRHFSDLPEYLAPGDLLILNNSKVVHARLIGIKESTGAKIELFLIHALTSTNVIPAKEGISNHSSLWEVLAKPGKRLHDGDTVLFGDDELYLRAEILGRLDGGTMKVRFTTNGSSFDETVEALGSMPLPPYIRREAGKTDEERYQTIFASIPGSVAAPTAGLHFTSELLEKLKAKGVRIAFVTLHVGLGTFRPVKVDEVKNHHMHTEEYFVSEETAREIAAAKAEGRRVICVGTTSVRTIESAAAEDGIVHAGESDTDIFIYPGYEWKVCDALITNFHLPKSTLLMLVSSFAGKDKIMKAYKHAVDENYRFFSYGDAMFIM